MNVYMKKDEKEKQLFYQGHTSCAGCSETIAIRSILKAAGPNTIISNPTGCSEIFSSCYPTTSWNVPYIHVAFETAASVASGIDAAMKKLRKKVNVIAIAGDGATYDIGLQALSGMIDRQHNVLYICLTNECYANTGLQRSSATPYAAATTTSPPGKFSIGNPYEKKPICEMLAAQGCEYVATASIAYPKDLQKKVKKALSINGPKFILVHCPCPLAWRFPSEKTVEIAKLAIDCGAFPIYEIENNEKKINMKPKFLPIKDYLKMQGRFKHLSDKDIKEIQKRINESWGL